MKTIRYVSLYNGRCGLKTDTKREILRRLGADNVREIRLATQRDVDHVRMMGGHVPIGRVSK